jgi:GH25 family lysozyme M1 (1,4-beta-N-acetylmuramidase)
VVYTSVTPFYYLATGIGVNPKQIAIRLTGTHDFLNPLVSATGQGWQYTNNGIKPQMY